MTHVQMDELVTQAKNGNHQAFSKLVMDNQNMIIRYCYSMLASRQDAEDIAQETFINAYKHLHRYSCEGNFKGWLMTIAHRLCLNRIKKNKRSFNLLKLIKTEQQVTTIQHDQPLNEEIFTLLKSLKPKARAIVVLKAIQGYNFEEISRIVGDKPVNLRKQYERAKKILKQKDSLIHNKKECEVHYEYNQKLRTTNT